MKRKHEFRVWDSIDKKMLYGLDITFHQKNDTVCVRKYTGYTAMEYTGRVDKFDTKIFESDVVKITKAEVDLFGAIVFNDESAAYGVQVGIGENANWIPLYSIDQDRIQVTSNIYKESL